MTTITILTIILAILIFATLIVCVISSAQGEGIVSIFKHALLCLAMLACIFGLNKIYDNVKYVDAFKEGTYQMNTEEVIKNCSDEADKLAMALYNSGQDTFNIKSNITNVKTELAPKFICYIPTEGEDTIVFIDTDEIKKMVDNKYIKFVS